jgi:hypothetical protein
MCIFAATPAVGPTFSIVYDMPELHKFANGANASGVNRTSAAASAPLTEPFRGATLDRVLGAGSLRGGRIGRDVVRS